MELRFRVGKFGSSVPDRYEMNTLEQKLVFSCLASSFEFILNNIKYSSFFCQVPEHGSYPLHRQRKDNGIAFVRGDFRQRLQITQLNRFGLFG